VAPTRKTAAAGKAQPLLFGPPQERNPLNVLGGLVQDSKLLAQFAARLATAGHDRRGMLKVMEAAGRRVSQAAARLLAAEEPE
jgi:hypothetical protein